MVDDFDHEEGEIDDCSDFEEDIPSPVPKATKHKKKNKRKNVEKLHGVCDSPHTEEIDDGVNYDNFDSEIIPGRKRKKNKDNSRHDINPKRQQVMIQKCKYYSEGRCNKGDECSYSHDFIPPKKPELCRYYAAGNCSKGNSCVFYHEDFPCRYFNTSFCKLGEKCRFSHKKLTAELKEMLDRHISETVSIPFSYKLKANNSNQNGDVEQELHGDIDYRKMTMPVPRFKNGAGPNIVQSNQRSFIRQPSFGAHYVPPNPAFQMQPINMTQRVPPPMGPRVQLRPNHFNGVNHEFRPRVSGPIGQPSDTDFRPPPNRHHPPYVPPNVCSNQLPHQRPNHAFTYTNQRAVRPVIPENIRPFKNKPEEIDAIFESELDKMAALLASNKANEKEDKQIDQPANGSDPRLAQRSPSYNKEYTVPEGGGLPSKPVVWRLIKLNLKKRVPYLMMNIPSKDQIKSTMPDPRLKAGVNILAHIPSSPPSNQCVDSSIFEGTIERDIEKELSPKKTVINPVLDSIDKDKSEIHKPLENLELPIDLDFKQNSPIPRPASGRKPIRLQLNEMASLGGSSESQTSTTKTDTQVISNDVSRSYLEDPRFRRRKILQPVSDGSNVQNNDN